MRTITRKRMSAWTNSSNYFHRFTFNIHLCLLRKTCACVCVHTLTLCPGVPDGSPMISHMFFFCITSPGFTSWQMNQQPQHKCKMWVWTHKFFCMSSNAVINSITCLFCVNTFCVRLVYKPLTWKRNRKTASEVKLVSPLEGNLKQQTVRGAPQPLRSAVPLTM